MPTRAINATTKTTALNWAAVSEAVRARRAQLGLTQQEVIDRMDEARCEIEALRRVERNDQPSYRRGTLAAISTALGWPAAALWDIACGKPAPASEEAATEMLSRIERLEAQVDRLAALLLPQPDDPPSR